MRQGASLDRKKLMADPIMVTTIVVLIAFLTLFILYPLAILLVDSFYGQKGFSLDTFRRILAMSTFRTAIWNTLKVGFLVGILSALLGLLFAYVEVYVKLGKFSGGLFRVVSMLPVVSPPFVLSLSMIMLFGKAGLITRFLLKIYDNSVYGFWGIAIVQTLTFFPVCYMMLKGLLKNIDLPRLSPGEALLRQILRNRILRCPDRRTAFHENGLLQVHIPLSAPAFGS